MPNIQELEFQGVSGDYYNEVSFLIQTLDRNAENLKKLSLHFQDATFKTNDAIVFINTIKR